MALRERNMLQRLDGGQYLALDRHTALVRSTISIARSHDGRFLASTHGDHTVKVFKYPSMEQVAILEGHIRTAWALRFHPTDSNIVVSGCLGGTCMVWDVARNECTRKHTFKKVISCVSFHPTGNVLLITSGKHLLLWDYLEETGTGAHATCSKVDGEHSQGLPRQLLQAEEPFHLVDFHPSGDMLMVGEKNVMHHAVSSLVDAQFTLKLTVYRYEQDSEGKIGDCVFTMPRVVAYNDAGVDFSACGRMLAVCVPDQGADDSFHIAVIGLKEEDDVTMGSSVCALALDRGHVMALTTLSFSPTSKHLLAGYSFKPDNPVLRAVASQNEAELLKSLSEQGEDEVSAPQVCVVDIYHVGNGVERVARLNSEVITQGWNRGAAEDGINCAKFTGANDSADGVVYGTQHGRIRIFRADHGGDASDG